MHNCIKCGNQVREGAAFCEQCGSKVNTPDVREKSKISENHEFQSSKGFFQRMFQGRISRSFYFFGVITLVVLYIPSYVIDNHSDAISTFSVFVIVLYIFYAFFMVSLQVRRLHDLDLSGWLFLVLLIPGIGIALGLYLLFGKGTKGMNKYGEEFQERPFLRMLFLNK